MVSTPLREFPGEQELPGFGPRTASDPPATLARYHGRRVNYSALARTAAVSCQTARRRLLDLEHTGYLRLLRPLGEPRGKSPAPVLYLRSPPLLAALPEAEQRRARLVEALAPLVQSCGGRLGYLSRPHGAVVEPAIEVPSAAGPALVGLRLLADTAGRRGMWATLTRAQRQGLLRQGFVLYPGSRAYFSSARVAVVPERSFLHEYGEWMAAALDPSPEALQQLMRRCNAPRVR